MCSKHTQLRDSSPKNENDVMNYSPPCRSKPVRPSFIFRTQIKIFLMKSENSQTLHRQQHNSLFFQVQKCRKDNGTIVHMTTRVHPWFYEAMRILFVCMHACACFRFMYTMHVHGAATYVNTHTNVSFTWSGSKRMHRDTLSTMEVHRCR